MCENGGFHVSMIRGYHEYIHIWESPSPTDNLFCQREIGNPHNTHAVAIKGTQWLFIRDWMHTYTGYLSGTTKLKSIFDKNER